MKGKNTRLNAYTLLILLFVLIAAGCQLNVPIKEMVKAKKGITRAYQVKADVYDPDNLEKASEHLLASHNELKSGSISTSKEKAIKAAAFAEEAIKKSLPLLAADTLADAKKINEEADMLYAERFAPEEFKNAESLIQQAGAHLAAESFWESYLKSDAARQLAAAAKNKSIDAIPSLKSEIERLRGEASGLQTQTPAEPVKNDIDRALALLKEADQHLLDNRTKQSFAAINSASGILDGLRLKMKILSLEDKIKNLRMRTESLKNDRGAAYANEDIEIIISALNEADAFLKQDKTDEASARVNDAEKALEAALLKTKRGIAEEKIKKVEQRLAAAREKAGSEKLQPIEDAAALLAEARNLFSLDDYDGSIAKADAAESLLNSLSVAGEKTAEISDKGAVIPENSTLYIVQYNKKNRDCLWRIAEKMYRNARLWPLIYIANKDQIKDPDLIFPGQRFVIPPLKRSNIKGVKPEALKNKPSEKPSASSDTQAAPAVDNNEPNAEEPAPKTTGSGSDSTDGASGPVEPATPAEGGNSANE